MQFGNLEYHGLSRRLQASPAPENSSLKPAVMPICEKPSARKFAIIYDISRRFLVYPNDRLGLYTYEVVLLKGYACISLSSGTGGRSKLIQRESWLARPNFGDVEHHSSQWREGGCFE